MHLGHEDWLFRIRCRPDGSTAIAEALARRDDVQWVALAAGSSEVSCQFHVAAAATRDDLLDRLPRTAAVLDISTHVVIHRFMGRHSNGWVGYDDVLTPAQIERLDVRTPPPATPPIATGPEDALLLDALAADGRSSFVELATVTGWSEGQVARRVESLLTSGALYFDVDVSTDLMGYGQSSLIWLRVVPSDLDTTGRLVIADPHVSFAAAVTGQANIVASVIYRDSNGLVRVPHQQPREDHDDSADGSHLNDAAAQAGRLTGHRRSSYTSE